MIGATWMPDDPVPIRPTRLPCSSGSSRGQAAVKYTSPEKSSAPAIFGRFTADRQPVAHNRNWAA